MKEILKEITLKRFDLWTVSSKQMTVGHIVLGFYHLWIREAFQ